MPPPTNLQQSPGDIKAASKKEKDEGKWMFKVEVMGKGADGTTTCTGYHFLRLEEKTLKMESHQGESKVLDGEGQLSQNKDHWYV